MNGVQGVPGWVVMLASSILMPAMAGEIGIAVHSTRSGPSVFGAVPRATEYAEYGDPTDLEQYLLELTNRGRADPAGESARYGNPNDHPAAPPLALNKTLLEVARAHSKDMHDRNFFDHTNPDGKSPFDRMTAAGYAYSAAGENIGKNYPDVEAMHQGWLNSSGHRANIYNASFREIGPGLYFGSSKLYTENFGAQLSGPTKFILGVVYNDANGNSFYDPGEGLSGVRVEFTAAGTNTFMTTGSAGGYALPYASNGTYGVTASGGSLSNSMTASVTASGANVKQDFVAGSGGGGGGGASAPTITSSLSASGVEGASFAYTITATGDATINFSTTALPPGLSRSGETISGFPSVAGTYTVTLSASNGAGSDSKSLTITIAAAVYISHTSTDTDGDGFPDEVEDALNTSPSNSSDTPFNGNPAGTVIALTVLKALIKLNFATTNEDMVLVQGSLPIPAGFDVNGAQITVDVGGVIKTFTLDEKGKSPVGDDSFRIGVKARQGVVEAQDAKFIARFKNGDFSASVEDEGLIRTVSISKVNREVPVLLLFNATMYRVDRGVLYTAKANKKGVAK